MSFFEANNAEFEQPIYIDIARFPIFLAFTTSAVVMVRKSESRVLPAKAIEADRPDRVQLFFAPSQVLWFRTSLINAMSKGQLTSTVTTLLSLLISCIGEDWFENCFFHGF